MSVKSQLAWPIKKVTFNVKVVWNECLKNFMSSDFEVHNLKWMCIKVFACRYDVILNESTPEYVNAVGFD